MIRFEWDETKNQANITKHGISFERAKTIFDHPTLTWQDSRKEYGEIRKLSLGLMDGTAIIVMIHTERSGIIRIISARPANKKEKDSYYEFTQGRKNH
jgi:uncharacterized DUF497 family protein